MIMELLRPRNVEEALAAGSQPGAAYLGGGTWLNSPNAQGITRLVSLERLGLSSISTGAGRVSLEARVTFQQIADAPGLPAAIREAAGLTASRTLRTMVTVGGELGLLPDDSAFLCALLALEARVMLAGASAPIPASIPIERFLVEPARGLILSVVLESLPDYSAVRSVARTSHCTRSLVVGVVAGSLQAKVIRPRIVVGDCRSAAGRLTEVEGRLEGSPLPLKTRIEEWVREVFHPARDPHASAAYKRYMAGVLVADALHGLAAQSARSPRSPRGLP